MTATVTVVGAVLGCIIVILLVVCGGTLLHLSDYDREPQVQSLKGEL
jgi:hypothetical protein